MIMKKIKLDSKTISAILGILSKKFEVNEFFILASCVSSSPGTKFGRLRKEANNFEKSDTLYGFIYKEDEEIHIHTGGERIIIPFGLITLAYDSIFFKNQKGHWVLRFFKGSIKEDFSPDSFLGFGSTGWCPLCQGPCGNEKHSWGDGPWGDFD
jgi:hypothetical protein